MITIFIMHHVNKTTTSCGQPTKNCNDIQFIINFFHFSARRAFHYLNFNSNTQKKSEEQIEIDPKHTTFNTSYSGASK